MTDDPIKARQTAWLEEAGAMTMSLARKSHVRAEAQLDDLEPAAPNAKDETIRFTRLVACVRQTIAAEARIVAGPAPTARPPLQLRSTAAADPRHAVVRRALHQAVRNFPDGARTRRVIDEALDQELTADPAQRVHPSLVLTTIAERLGIPINFAILPDELLPEDDEDEDEPDDHDPSGPHDHLHRPPRPGD